MKKIFYPFLTYLGLFIYLSASMAGAYLKSLDEKQATVVLASATNSTSNSTLEAFGDDGTSAEDQFVRILTMAISLIILYLWW